MIADIWIWDFFRDLKMSFNAFKWSSTTKKVTTNLKPIQNKPPQKLITFSKLQLIENKLF